MRERVASGVIAGAVAGLAGLLAVRLAVDVHAAPIYEDEALAGLVSARPLREALGTAVLDRGGAPLHFLLAHVALGIDASPASLRWLSVVFAVATVPVCFDLGRRLAGSPAGVAAAGIVATSQLVGIYGSVGRMYALFAFAASLSVDLFVRACVLRTLGAALLAAAAAWFVVATHPFGIVLALAEAVIGVVLWRGGRLWSLLAVGAVGLLVIPFVVADERFADRFSAGVSGNAQLVTPSRAVAVLGRALGGLGGGREPLFVVFALLALIGGVALWRRRPGFVVLAAVVLAALPLLLVVARSPRGYSDHLSARQFIFALPLWAGLVGAGVERLVRSTSALLRWGAVGVLIGAAAIAPQAVADPRTADSGKQRALVAPATWLRAKIAAGDVVFPSSPVFLAALPESRRAFPLPREQPLLVTRSLRRVRFPVREVFVAVPLDGVQVATGGPNGTVFRSWLLVRLRGPFATPRVLLGQLVEGIEEAALVIDPKTPRVSGYLRQSRAALCGALHAAGGRCR